MSLPENLKAAISAEIGAYSIEQLAQASDALSKRYRDKEVKGKLLMASKDDRNAYLAARLPATYAVIHRVMAELKTRAPLIEISSLLDLGSGPGTALWAVSDIFPEIRKATLVEYNAELIELSQRLMRVGTHPLLNGTKWQRSSLAEDLPFEKHDLVVLSYVIGELTPSVIANLVQRSWQATSQALVIIEPGTPEGFERIRAVRQQLIDLGACMAAPCPHALECPMPKGDWCHFSERVERSSRHRLTKGGTLGYEDEKYSYVAFTRTPCVLPNARVLRHPMKHSGHIGVVLCTPEGLVKKTISRKDGDFYKKARKIEWGDTF